MLDLDCWKQKIPVSLFAFFGKDHTARFVYMELLMMAAFNDDDRKKTGPQKGQCFFSTRELAKRLRMTRQGLHRVTSRLTRKYKLISISTTDECSICTLLNYDNVTGRNDKKKKPVDTQLAASRTKSQLSAIKENNKEKILSTVPDQTGSTVSTLTPLKSPPPPSPQGDVDVVIDLFAMARDNPEVARRLVAMGVV